MAQRNVIILTPVLDWQLTDEADDQRSTVVFLRCVDIPGFLETTRKGTHKNKDVHMVN